VPTYHPAAALRGGDRVTDDIRADLRLVRSIIDGNLIDATTDDLVREPDEGQRASIDHQLDLFGGQT
jgi:predicted SnoaL-like aldol condensation-catalyzing enzyme